MVQSVTSTGRDSTSVDAYQGTLGSTVKLVSFFLNDCSPNNYLGMNLWMKFTLSTVNEAKNKCTKKLLLLTIQQIIVNLAGNFVPYDTH